MVQKFSTVDVSGEVQKGKAVRSQLRKCLLFRTASFELMSGHFRCVWTLKVALLFNRLVIPIYCMAMGFFLKLHKAPLQSHIAPRDVGNCGAIPTYARADLYTPYILEAMQLLLSSHCEFRNTKKTEQTDQNADMCGG